MLLLGCCMSRRRCLSQNEMGTWRRMSVPQEELQEDNQSGRNGIFLHREAPFPLEKDLHLITGHESESPEEAECFMRLTLTRSEFLPPNMKCSVCPLPPAGWTGAAESNNKSGIANFPQFMAQSACRTQLQDQVYKFQFHYGPNLIAQMGQWCS